MKSTLAGVWQGDALSSPVSTPLPISPPDPADLIAQPAVSPCSGPLPTLLPVDGSISASTWVCASPGCSALQTAPPPAAQALLGEVTSRLPDPAAKSPPAGLPVHPLLYCHVIQSRSKVGKNSDSALWGPGWWNPMSSFPWAFHLLLSD